MAATNSLGGLHVLPQIVRGDHMFCHGQSRGTIFRGDQLKNDRSALSQPCSFTALFTTHTMYAGMCYGWKITKSGAAGGEQSEPPCL